ncbi:MAG: transketolase [Chloroflexi bacterium]|nr:MAG: transketolase [Chloroflexota bacterium]MBL1195786.1 transketolase [Chloroflexota bacterium]NOH13077.1 transketolase [Chloroflexota bacterium]
MTASPELQEKAINTIRFLSADAVQTANSGHPGLPMGTAAIAYTLWKRHLRHNPKNPTWLNRDRFILSGGHGSMLLYSLLHLTGYDVSLDAIKNFRQWESITPGHPEYGLTAGVETTTGPLGQGLANGVGMAIAEAHLAARYNKPGHNLIDHYIYAIVTDGDLMEGVAAEAASFAGHLKLGKIVYVYDDNRISIDGSTDVTFTEDRGKRFEAYGWHVQHVEDGNDVEAIDSAIQAAKGDERPSIIVARTHIGYGLPTRQDTAAAHGQPPGEEELAGAKDKLGWPQEPWFFIPEDVLEHYRESIDKGTELEKEWQQYIEVYRKEHAELAADLDRIQEDKLPEDWDAEIPVFEADDKGMATRVSNGKVINAIAPLLPDLIGGSADLTGSTKTWIDDSPSYQAEAREARNFNFGVREHGMGAVVNGLETYPGIIPFGATFLVFSDYMRAAIRLSALSHWGSIWVLTHDSVGVGEDGPTHQPVEHLAALRAIPNLVTLRPGDANEVAEAWRVAIERRHGPTSLIFTRQNVPTLDRSVYAPADGVQKGAYVLADLGEGAPEIILMASGSEVGLMVTAGERLAAEGHNVRLVSFPSWELFRAQEQGYRDEVLLPDVKARLAIEAGVSQGWREWIGDTGDMVAIDRFGASAPGAVIFEKLGFTVENVVQKALALKQ